MPQRGMCYICSTMKTATLRELRTRYSTVMKWIEDGEVVKISKQGKIIARLLPEKPKARRKVDDRFLSPAATRTTK